MFMKLSLHRTAARAFALLAGVIAGMPAFAVAPAYHFEKLVAPADVLTLTALAMNDAGQIVGYYGTEDGEYPFLYDATGFHPLAVPQGGIGQATAISNGGVIVGYAQIGIGTEEMRSPGLVWSAADPGSVAEMQTTDPAIFLMPYGVNDNGVAVGVMGNLVTGEFFHGFAWTAATGAVDYGMVVPSNDSGSNTYFTAINNAGLIVGSWANAGAFGQGPPHAAKAQFGTIGPEAMSDTADEWPSAANAVSPTGLVVGEMDFEGDGIRVPVTFDGDGVPHAIEGATLGLSAGRAASVNASGAVVGRAMEGFESFKSFLCTDACYDLWDIVDGHADFNYFLTAQAINTNGAIVGTAHFGDFQTWSYVLTPRSDSIFADGFEGATR